MAQVSLDELNRMDRSDFVAALGDLFENSPWIAAAVCGARPFASLRNLYDAMCSAVLNFGEDRQLAFIKMHPDLAGKAMREGALGADSKLEQASAGLDRLSDAEFAEFHRLNDAYQKKFGIPFVICVRRHGKESILRQFNLRLGNDAATERQAALAEIFRIVALRLDLRTRGPGRLNVHGRLSTHVLDTYHGRPAPGIPVALFEIDPSSKARLVTRTTTNEDGRTEPPLMSERPIPIAQYELNFDVTDYFARQGAGRGDPPFLGVVPVRFAVAEPEGHYHVPLLLTPWSYTTYRGS